MYAANRSTIHTGCIIVSANEAGEKRRITFYLLNLLIKVERMKVAGFSFIKNAIKYQYPVAEAIQSILPLCNEVIVAVGNSEDNTRELITSIDPEKIKIIDTVWDESLKEGGRVLAAETDKAFHAINNYADWCIYIQGDGWVREPKAMQAKYSNFGRYWNGDGWSEELEKTYSGEVDYSNIDALEKFIGTHPNVMQNRVDHMN